MNEKGNPEERRIPLWAAFLPVVVLIGALWLSLVHYQERELTVHVPLIIAAAAAAIVGRLLGMSWKRLQEGMVENVSIALGAILILLVIGILVATWIQSGIVPTMVYYGLELIGPKSFLPMACLTCAFISLATGSSWSTVATVGIALMGVGTGLGLSKPMVAGAIISGAYFGDKLSPLSDTTNLAPATVGVDLFDHIRHMLATTGPSLVLSLVGFTVLGLFFTESAVAADVEGLKGAIERTFVIHPLLLLPPLMVVVMVVMRLPALPSLLGGSLLGALVAVFVQKVAVVEVFAVSMSGFAAQTGNQAVDALLSRGGLESMYSTIALIILALAFGGIMARSGMLAELARPLLKWARGTGRLVSAVLATCFSMNVLAADQYLAIVLPGRMYKDAFVAMGLKLKNLSRALEDSGTLTSVLIPWNTCGAFIIATLDLSPWTYVPFCFLNLLNPLISAFYGFTGITMERES